MFILNNLKEFLLKKLLSSEYIRKWLAYTFKNKYLASVSLVAFDKNGKILLCTHMWNEKFKWRLPGGLVEKKDKDLRNALMREIFEELGIKLKKDSLTLVETRKVRGFSRIDSYFSYKKPLPNLPSPINEVKEAKLFSISKLPISLFPGQREIIESSQHLFLTKH